MARSTTVGVTKSVVLFTKAAKQTLRLFERDAAQPERAHDDAQRPYRRDGQALRRVAGGEVVGQEDRHALVPAQVKALLLTSVEVAEALGFDEGRDVAGVWVATDAGSEQIVFRNVALADHLAPHLFRSAHRWKDAQEGKAPCLVEVDQRTGVGDGVGYFP